MEEEIKAIRDEDTSYDYAGSGVTSGSGDIYVQEDIEIKLCEEPMTSTSYCVSDAEIKAAIYSSQ